MVFFNSLFTRLIVLRKLPILPNSLLLLLLSLSSSRIAISISSRLNSIPLLLLPLPLPELPLVPIIGIVGVSSRPPRLDSAVAVVVAEERRRL